MHRLSTKHALVLLCTASIAALGGAYVAQYYFGMAPCELCLWQRKPYFVIIALTILFLAVPHLKKYQKLGVQISIVFLLINCAISFYHSGVERKYFSGLSSCSSVSTAPTSIIELQKMLMSTRAIPCDQPQFIFLDLSMAEWNLVYCLIVIFLSCIFLKPEKHWFRKVHK